MTELNIRDVEYTHAGTRLLGLHCAPEAAVDAPTVVLLHDAFGLADEMVSIARRIALLGFSVFAADIWGDRATPGQQHELGPLIGAMVSRRATWIERVALAHEVALAQPGSSRARPISLGYCFGGSSALEYARSGGDVRAVIAIHPGLDLIEFDWSSVEPERAPAALVCFGADDPMATPEQWRRTKANMSAAGVDWELHLYSGTVHGFTSPRAADSPDPETVMYHPRNAARAWRATEDFLIELRDGVRF
ncbi:dienelactone hydrolase family protein [Leucobacter rhizosphaerae]|uniref:Dienelactone hydrolase family protein n=1 Tax=Leucobacter rhizosphaerae TaxID=2932245 RepID=A0ABY4FTV9_9MICO|nr:dienelactone hydrolase family protein [Leucobacter rhizosphaerae]UOQ59692.1 dienelactone hydrolase family protein [Leucobacter rhizosphaerae]